jgi:hypothetical protein
VTLEQLYFASQIAAAAAIVASLIFVGVQVKQNTNLAAGETQRELMNGFQAQLERITAEPDLFRRGLSGLHSLSETEKVQFSIIFNQFVNHLELPLRMVNRGLETQDNVDLYGNICVAFLLEPGGLEIWERTRPYYFPLSRGYVESRLANPETLPPRVSEVYPWFNTENDSKIADVQ